MLDYETIDEMIIVELRPWGLEHMIRDIPERFQKSDKHSGLKECYRKFVCDEINESLRNSFTADHPPNMESWGDKSLSSHASGSNAAGEMVDA